MPARRIAPFAIAAIAVAVFAPALQYGFILWDDDRNLLTNPSYRGLGWAQIRWAFTSAVMGHWIPVTWLTFGLDHTLWGMNAFGYHLTNVLLHAANAVLFYFLARRLLRHGLPTVPAWAITLGASVAALFFAVHPLRVESVVWVTERRDVLSALFYLVTVLAYVQACAADGPPRYVQRPYIRVIPRLFPAADGQQHGQQHRGEAPDQHVRHAFCRRERPPPRRTGCGGDPRGKRQDLRGLHAPRLR